MLLEIACEKLTSELIVELMEDLTWDEKHDVIHRKLTMVASVGFNEGRKQTGGYNKKRVIQMNLVGQPVKLFNSAREAGRITGINFSHILKVCQKQKSRKTAGGFKWEFANEKY